MMSTYRTPTLRIVVTPNDWRVKDMMFFRWFQFAKANCRKEQGQTMAEYGVVLAVVTLGIVLTLIALAGGINGALNSVVGWL